MPSRPCPPFPLCYAHTAHECTAGMCGTACSPSYAYPRLPPKLGDLGVQCVGGQDEDSAGAVNRDGRSPEPTTLIPVLTCTSTSPDKRDGHTHAPAPPSPPTNTASIRIHIRPPPHIYGPKHTYMDHHTQTGPAPHTSIAPPTTHMWPTTHR